MTITIGGQSQIQRGPFDPKRQFQFIRGFNTDVDTANVPQTVWANPLNGQVALASAPGQISIVSDDADDTSAGTGARTVLIQGVDSSFDPVEEVISMNGLTPVLTVGSDFIFVNTAIVATAGTSKANEGNISFAIGAALVNVAPLGFGITQTAAQVLLNPLQPGTVPNFVDFVFAVGRVNASLATVSLIAESNITIFSQEISIASDGGPFHINVKGSLPFAPGTFVHAEVVAVSANNTAVNANLQFLYL